MNSKRRSGQAPTATKIATKSASVAALVQAQAVRLGWDARCSYAAKLARKRYGEKITHEITGPKGGPEQTLQMPDLTALRAAIARARANVGPRNDRPGLIENGSE
jgi:hypothetical protein